MNANFDKYKKRGSYHWDAVHGSFYLRSMPIISRYMLCYNMINAYTNKPLTEAHGLDVGCGEGVFMHHILSHGGRIDGVDNEEVALGMADTLLKPYKSKYNLYNATCESMPIRNKSKDYITSLEVIEHLTDVHAFLSEVNRILKDDGLFVLSTPRSRENNMLQDPYHVREYDEQELYILLHKYFKSIHIYGAWPLNISDIWRHRTNYKIVNMMIRLCWRIAYLAKMPCSDVFEKRITRKPDENWDLLLAVAIR